MSRATGGKVAVYVTSHGFGHLNRSVAVINQIPADIDVAIRSDPSLFPAWRERLKRAAVLEAHVSDAGALNPPGDSAATDGPATLIHAAEVHAWAMTEVDAESARLRTEGTSVVLADAPPVPLVAAHRTRIPGLLLANFTWAEIYLPYARAIERRTPWPHPQAKDAWKIFEQVRDAYAAASLFLRAEPGLSLRLPVDRQPPIRDLGLVVTPGVDRRAELRSFLGLDADPDARMVYFYFGRYGQDDLRWERLAGFAGVHFVGFHAPAGSPPNVHTVPADRWTGADLAASSDAMIAKAGYGTASEAMAAGTPLIYPPRTGFAEHRALDRALRAWGGGVPISARDLREFRLGPALDQALGSRPGPPPFPLDGVARVVAILQEAIADPARFLRP